MSWRVRSKTERSQKPCEFRKERSGRPFTGEAKAIGLGTVTSETGNCAVTGPEAGVLTVTHPAGAEQIFTPFSRLAGPQKNVLNL